jgi:hypothetical protein
MPSTPKVDPVEILTQLSDDPHVNFYPWKMNVQDASTTLARTLHPLGLLSSILTARQWEEYPGNTTTDAQGQVQIAPRYTPPAYTELDPNMSSVQLYFAKDKNDRLLQLWMDASDVLKRAVTVIKSLGESVREIISIKTSRFQQITVAEIIERVRARFGQLQKDTKTSLKLRMTSMLKSVADLDKHISALTKNFTISETAGSVIDEDHKVDYFRDSLFGHPILADILKQFDFEHPDCNTITYAQITAYVVLYLPNLKTAQQAATRVQANIVRLDAYAALQLETKQLRDDVQTLKRKRSSDNSNPNNKKQKQKQKQNRNRTKDQTPARERLARTGDKPIESLDYCHNHGYQHSHKSSA